MQAKNIDEVIAFLEQIINDSKNQESRMGYFAALYYNVTLKVKEGILKKEFENNERMEKLDVIFANRYLKAYAQFKNNETPSGCWEIAFQATQNYWPVVLQHLLLGMNAHINLDLGIAAAEVSPGDKIHGLKNDFDLINKILASLVKSVEEDLSEVWPRLKWILRFTRKIDTFFINFSMKIARDGAWKFATELAPLEASQNAEAITARDKRVAAKAGLITSPGWIASLIFKMIKIGERGTIKDRIDWMVAQNSDVF